MDIQHAYLNACLSELQALKPGNVHVFADGHGMQVQDFIDSAEVSALALCADERFGQRTLGQRMLQALQATHAKVACNTNLGIVLLAGPLVHAKRLHPDLPIREALALVLADTTVADAEAVYQAIRLVKPAGMGQQAAHDVSQPADIDLLQAMQFASAYDNVAYQYVSQYQTLFEQALPCYAFYYQRWQRPAWALTSLYLYWLAHWPDSHIARKYGNAQAQAIQQTAQQHFAAFTALENPKKHMGALLAWDTTLKQAGINPGTSADLTVITALLAALDGLPV